MRKDRAPEYRLYDRTAPDSEIAWANLQNRRNRRGCLRRTLITHIGKVKSYLLTNQSSNLAEWGCAGTEKEFEEERRKGIH